MFKILAVLLILASAFVGVWWYHRHSAITSFSGDVVARDGQYPPAATSPQTGSDSNAGNQAPAPNGSPVQESQTAQNGAPAPDVATLSPPDLLIDRTGQLASPPSIAPVPAPAEPAPVAPAPGHDSQPANLPNNVRVSGSGSYQWYRQGDLTWRVDTQSGRSCVDFATLDQWRNPVVYSHGCGNS